jgi:hypothetical protein
MTSDDDLFVDDVMRECWERKAEVSSRYTWDTYDAYHEELHKRLEAEGWKFADPADVPTRR